jgi:hypothetical protein
MNRDWSEESGITRAKAPSRRKLLIGTGAAAALLLPQTARRSMAAREVAAQGASERFMVIRHYQLAPEVDVADVLRATEEGFVPVLREIAGFVEYYNIDLGSGEGLTISVFASQAGAEESTARAAAWVQANLAGSFQGPPEVLAGPVRLHVTTGDASSEPSA